MSLVIPGNVGTVVILVARIIIVIVVIIASIMIRGIRALMVL